MKRVFLGGTLNSTWREFIKSKLDIGFFDPVVDDWTKEFQKEEIKQRDICDYCLYVITPKMSGVYSIAEVIDDSNKRPERTIFCFLSTDMGEGFSPTQLNSLIMVGKMVQNNGGKFFSNLPSVIQYLNKK